MANTTYTVLQKWANQYKALEQANRSAESKVEKLGVLGGVSAQKKGQVFHYYI